MKHNSYYRHLISLLIKSAVIGKREDGRTVEKSEHAGSPIKDGI
jgi:hypothetical protein